MGSILDNYKKQLEEDRLNESFDFPDNMVGDMNDEVSVSAYKEELKRLREDDNDMEAQYQKFHQTYTKMSEHDLTEQNLTKCEPVQVMVKHAYCPKCGKELVSKFPVMFNPYTMEKICKYDCECGFTANLEFAYPRVMFVDSEGKEIEAFPR